MSASPVPAVRVALSVASALVALLAVLAGPADAATGSAGGPLSADVRLRSLMGVPPEGYSLFCMGQPSCTTGGNVDLETKADVSAEFDPDTRTTHGVGRLPFSKAEGTVDMSWACGSKPGRWESQVSVTGTKAGELEVVDVEAAPGANELAVTLDPAGDSGGEFPREVVERNDGGCDVPVQELTQTMGTWYYHFYFARQGALQQFGDVKLDDLSWHDGVYSKTFDRFVTAGVPPYQYPLYERTTIEVEPEYCSGKQNQIVSATSDGESLGIDGMRFYLGQQFTAPRKTRMRFADGSVIDIAKGGSFTVSDCSANATEVTLTKSIGSFWMHFKHLVKGPSKKFDVITKRSAVGVRGTIFEVSYDKAAEKTKVAVSESEVSLEGRNGASGKVMIEPGQVGVQKGKQKPRIVKR